MVDGYRAHGDRATPPLITGGAFGEMASCQIVERLCGVVAGHVAKLASVPLEPESLIGVIRPIPKDRASGVFQVGLSLAGAALESRCAFASAARHRAG